MKWVCGSTGPQILLEGTVTWLACEIKGLFSSGRGFWAENPKQRHLLVALCKVPEVLRGARRFCFP